VFFSSKARSVSRRISAPPHVALAQSLPRKSKASDGNRSALPRLYFDQRNAIDLYGKTRPMLLSIVSPCRVMEAHRDLVDVAHAAPDRLRKRMTVWRGHSCLRPRHLPRSSLAIMTWLFRLLLYLLKPQRNLESKDAPKDCGISPNCRQPVD